MKKIYDIIAIGAGPFNLSLASLLKGKNLNNFLVLEKNKEFNWHHELIFKDSTMQTSFLKDLVTPVDPTNENSFLNYLVQNDLYYQFLNTERSSVNRIEYEAYLKWASKNLSENIIYNSLVISVDFDINEKIYIIKDNNSEYYSKNICVGTGPCPSIPSFAKNLISKTLHHAKSEFIKTMDIHKKNVLVIGGGQTGLEIFRNALKSKWGRPLKIEIISDRQTFIPLEEGSFTNDFFTPSFMESFFTLDQNTKDQIVQNQKFMSDGNTPSYIKEFYNELYMDKYYYKELPDYEISPMRTVEDIKKEENSYIVSYRNKLNNKLYTKIYDHVILATGMHTKTPEFLEKLLQDIAFDDKERFLINEDYSINKKNYMENKIYVQNFSRHCHGITDPQTSMMAWRSAVIANSVSNQDLYRTKTINPIFCNYSHK